MRARPDRPDGPAFRTLWRSDNGAEAAIVGVALIWSPVFAPAARLDFAGGSGGAQGGAASRNHVVPTGLSP